MLAMRMLDENLQNLESYLNQFAYLGEYAHKEEQPFYKVLLPNVRDLTIVKPIIESCCGYDLITGEDLTEMERNMKVVGALVDLAFDVSATTVATIGNYCDWSMGVTLLLSLGTELTVGQVGTI